MKKQYILVALDSGHDSAAFDRALAVARSAGAELYLLHAVPADQRYSFDAAERLQRSIDLRQRAGEVGVTIQTVEQQGDPAEIIVLHAESRAVDLIVMASERRSGWARFRQPSVAERVLRATTRPTLVVRDENSRRDSRQTAPIAADVARETGTIIDTVLQLSASDRPLLVRLGATAARTLRNTDRAVLAVPAEARPDLIPVSASHHGAA